MTPMDEFNAYLESEEFEALMQEYRHARVGDPVHVLLSFAHVQNALLLKFVDVTEEDLNGPYS